ncbi:MAG: ArsA family ATPase, partial [Deltaproteobacteria bacterium]|nr:ArsA family ATPase [Deltaproteobacteria bacterium]
MSWSRGKKAADPVGSIDGRGAAAPPGSPRFFERRFVIVMGKGGVGKSTVAAAIAIAAARLGKRVLVCELKTAERISRLFGSAPVGTEIGRVAEGIDAVNMTPQSALREVALLKLRLMALYRLTFENRVVADFLRGVPGLPELLMLGKCYYHEQETDPATGRPRWDMVVVDAPATGHGIPFLRIPRVILDLFGESPITHEASQIQALLLDGQRTSLNLVTLPEELPTAEVLALKAQVDTLLRIPTGYLFVNQVLL